MEVIENGRSFPLSPGPSLKVVQYHREFDWGFAGPAVDQLAAAILLDLSGDKAVVTKKADDVKWALLASAPRAGVEISEGQVRELLK